MTAKTKKFTLQELFSYQHHFELSYMGTFRFYSVRDIPSPEFSLEPDLRQQVVVVREAGGAGSNNNPAATAVKNGNSDGNENGSWNWRR